MQFSVRLIFFAMTVASLNAALGIYLLQRQLLTNSLLEFCNSGLLIFAIVLQISSFLVVALRAARRVAAKRFLIAGSTIFLTMFVLTRMYAETAGRWLWDHQKSFSTEWTPIEFIAGLTALLGVPLFCILSTMLTVLLWSAVRTNKAVHRSPRTAGT